MTLQFGVYPAVGDVDGEYRIFVHFLDDDGELMWTDDHDPPEPIARWQPQETITYSRWVTTPVFPYVGTATIALGLYSPSTGHRLQLDGEHLGQRAYKVATIELEPQSATSFLAYEEGWHGQESHPENPNARWRWTAKDAVVSFRNPQRDAVLYLQVDGRPDLFDTPQQLAIVVGDRVIDTFPVPADPVFATVPLPADALGNSGIVKLKLQVDNTFVPAKRTGQGTDERELGVRVHYAFVELR
jgi:hypothetical protein